LNLRALSAREATVSDLYDFGLKIGEFLRGVLRTAAAADDADADAADATAREAGSPTAEARGRKFPEAGVDFIQHDVRVRFTFEKGGEEVVTMHGAMLIQRDEARVGKLGLREVPFKVLSWAAAGWSNTLGASITYVLTADTEQPVSVIRAEQEGSDYPASFLFNVLFDVRVDNMTVYKGLHGRPEGEHFHRIPPSGDRAMSPTITKFSDIGKVMVKHPDLGEIVGTPIDCNDRQGRTVVTVPGLRRIKGEPHGY